LFSQETLIKTLLSQKNPDIKQGLPVEKKTLLTVAFISLFLVAVAGTQFVSLGQANPYIRDWKMEGEISPPDGTKPPIVSISCPMNNTSYPSNSFSLNFTATVEKSNDISLGLSEVYYVASWQKGRTDIDLYSLFVKNNYTWPSTFSINMTDVPEGPHWLEVYAVATGFAYETRHEVKGIYYTTYYVGYKITSSSVVNFTIDTTAPSVLSLSVENETFATSDVPLTLIVNEAVSQVTYSLDGQKNVTIAGNTTLIGLSSGNHKLTVYATDEAGNVGASETITFSVTVPEPFPTELVTVGGASAAFVSVGFVVYSLKFKKRMEKT
jgi:hypothetical protein